MVLCWAVAASSGLQAERHRKTKIKAASSPAGVMKRFPPLREIDIPEVVSHALSNGMELYLLEDHALPIVRGFASVRTGNLFDPPKKIALAGITGQVLRLGGTVSRTGPEIDEELESMAASVETSIGETSGSANFWTLKENIDRVLVIYADVLMNPAFRQDKIDLIKQQVRSGIARRNDDPGSIASREFTNLVYGRQTPYGWQLEYEHVDRIGKEDLEGFYQRYFFPANIKLAVYGDFSSDEMKAKVEKAFGNWTVEQPSVPPVPRGRAQRRGWPLLGREAGCQPKQYPDWTPGRPPQGRRLPGVEGDGQHPRRRFSEPAFPARSQRLGLGLFRGSVMGC